MKQQTRTRETRQRRVVYETVKETTSHPTADWIFDQVRTTLPKISLGTVYRNLAVLKDEGLVHEICGIDRCAHYDANISSHAHFICTDCGSISDVHSTHDYDWRSVKELVGCEVKEQRTRFLGVCAGCRHQSQRLD